MNITYLKELGKSLLLSLLIFLISTFLITIFYHFNIFSTSIYNIFKFLIPILSIFVGCYHFGKKAEKRGWLEGLKIGGILIILSLLIISIFFRSDLSFRLMLYDVIILLISLVGGMIGINRKKD